MSKLTNDRAWIARWKAEYHPCDNGVHVFQPEGGEFGGLTLQNFPGATLDVFRELSTAGDGDDFDLICDLFDGDGNIIDDVCIRRQDLELIERRLALSKEGAES